MDTREISTRLHDILRVACRVRQAGPGCTAEAAVESIDEVKSQLRALIQDLGGQEPPRLPPRLRANAVAFPEGRIAGTRATVQHRRRTRVPAPVDGASTPAMRRRSPAAMVRLASPRDEAEMLFRRPEATTAPQP